MAENTAAVPVVSLTSNNQLTTTSQNVAEVFGKQHKDVIRSIEQLKDKCPAEFTERNFAPSTYKDSTCRDLPMYLLTRDGLTLLVMGYTGKEAMKFKIAYIEAFNAMEAKLKAEQMKALSSGEGGPQGRERSENPALQTSSVSLRSTPSPEGKAAADDEIVRDLCFQVRQRLLKKSLPERIAVWKRVVAALEGEAESVPTAPKPLTPDMVIQMSDLFSIPDKQKPSTEWSVAETLRKALVLIDNAFQHSAFIKEQGRCSFRKSLLIACRCEIDAAGAMARALLAAEKTVVA